MVLHLYECTDMDVFGGTCCPLRVREVDKSIQIEYQASEDP